MVFSRKKNDESLRSGFIYLACNQYSACYLFNWGRVFNHTCILWIIEPDLFCNYTTLKQSLKCYFSNTSIYFNRSIYTNATYRPWIKNLVRKRLVDVFDFCITTSCFWSIPLQNSLVVITTFRKCLLFYQSRPKRSVRP